MSRAWPVKGVDPEGTLADNARRILTVRMGEFYSYEPVIPFEAAIEPLHDMRIAAKRLRYTLELFEVVFGDLGKRQIERVKAVQEDLGTLHDFDVRIHLVEDELRALTEEEIAATNDGIEPMSIGETTTPPDVRRGLLTLLTNERAARRERYRAFVARWNELREADMRGDLDRLSASRIVTATDGAASDLPNPGNGAPAMEDKRAEAKRYSAAF